MNDVREVMINGPSGLLNVGTSTEKPVYEPSRRRLVWPNGAEGHAFSAEEPDRLRGPQFDCAWLDEIATWSEGGERTYDMLQFGLRLGAAPRTMATTTPQPTALVKRLLNDPACAVTTASTARNAANLSPGFAEALRQHYDHSTLARQELDGELIEDRDGALWSQSMIDSCQVTEIPEFDRIVVAVDPATTSHAASDACGIIAVGKTGDCAFVLADETTQGQPPQIWAETVADLVRRTNADEVIAEANQDGEMIRTVLQAAGINLAIRLVHTSQSKTRRASPVAALYATGRVKHAQGLGDLEKELLDFGLTRKSPNRLDATVWGVSHLLLTSNTTPRIALI